MCKGRVQEISGTDKGPGIEYVILNQMVVKLLRFMSNDSISVLLILKIMLLHALLSHVS